MTETILPNDPEVYFTMDINSPPGTKVVFTGKNGWEYEIKASCELLDIGSVYTVTSIDIGEWKSRVYLEECPGYGFNSVHFVDAVNRVVMGACKKSGVIDV